MIDLKNNLYINYNVDYMPFIKIEIINNYKFIIRITDYVDAVSLYIILYSYIKNTNIQINKICMLIDRDVGVEYINLINILQFSLYDFMIFKDDMLNTNNNNNESNLFINYENIKHYELEIEIITFNNHNFNEYTKPITLTYNYNL